MLRTALAFAFLASPALAELRVEHAYIPETTPVARTAGGYFTATNDSEDTVRLTGITSALPRTEFHETVAGDGGMMRMEAREDGFEIAPGESLTLERGGRHVMFMGLTGQLVTGETLDATLLLGDGTEVPVTFEVVPPEMLEHDHEAMHADPNHGDHMRH